MSITCVSAALGRTLKLYVLIYHSDMYLLKIRLREEFKTKALQLQSDGQDGEARKMLARAAKIEYKHVRDLISVSTVSRFFISS